MKHQDLETRSNGKTYARYLRSEFTVEGLQEVLSKAGEKAIVTYRVPGRDLRNEALTGYVEIFETATPGMYEIEGFRTAAGNFIPVTWVLSLSVPEEAKVTYHPRPIGVGYGYTAN